MSRHTSTTPRVLLTLAALLLVTDLASAQTYWPGQNLDWERKSPEEAGFDPAKIQQAIEIAVAGESNSPRDLAFNHQMTFGREPHGEPVGPFTIRGPQTGVIVHKGYVIAEWGDPHKVDQTFSVSKSFLSTSVGLAYDRGMITDVHDLARPYVAPIVLEEGDGEPGDEAGRRPKLLFESEHNRKITWDHLLRQTSDWKEPYGESPSGQIDLIMTGQPGEPGPASSQVPRMNTTIPGSIYLRSQQQASGEDLFLTCYVNTLWIRSERHLRGAGTVTITHGSLWTVDGFKR